MRSAPAALLMLAACAQTPGASPGQSLHLSGTKWVRVDDLSANPHGPTLEFDGDRASGFTGCNRWFATTTQNGEELHFGPVGMTRMACQAEAQAATERSFVAALEATRYAHYDADVLVLLDSQQNRLVEFQSTLNR